jgi:hypothetical protein
MEVVLLLVQGSGASPFIEWVVLAPARVAGVAEGAPGALVVLAVEGAAGATPVVSGTPPALGGSVMPRAGAAPIEDGASLDTRFSSSSAVCSSIAILAVNAGSGPSVVWLVFLFFFFFFFFFFFVFFFFSSFFSSTSLGRRRRKGVRRKVSQGLKMLEEYS